MKCNRENCASDATHFFVWPGSGEAPSCYEHLRQARVIAKAMGFFLPVRPIETPPRNAPAPSVSCERCGTKLPALSIAGAGIDRDDVDLKGATVMIAIVIECTCGEKCGSIISRTFTRDAPVVDVVAAYAATEAARRGGEQS